MDPRLLVAQLEEFREALEGINANLQRAEDEFAKHAAEDAKERDAFSATRDRELRDAVASVEAASVALDADAEAGHARLVEHLDRLREDFTRSAAKGAAALLAHAGEISALSDAHAEFVKRVEAETAYQRVASAWPAEAARDFVEDAEAHRRMATLRVSARVEAAHEERRATRAERYAETFGGLAAWLETAREEHGEKMFEMRGRIEKLDARLGIDRGGRGARKPP